MPRVHSQELDDDEEKMLRKHRQNQQMQVYLLVSAIILLSWFLGLMSLSFLWVFGLIFLAFVVWYTKVFNIVELYIKEREISLHRRRALRQNESAEWLNFIVNRWWVFSAKSIQEFVRKKLNPLLLDILPSFLDHVEITKCDFGTKTPYIKYIKAFDYTDGRKNPATWSNITSPPDHLEQRIQYNVMIEADCGVHCPDFQMIFRTKLSSVGVSTDVAVDELTVAGKVQVTLQLDMTASFPHIQCVTVSFLEPPEVSFQLKVLKTLQIMEIPMLKSWLYNVVQNGLAQALVDPGKMDFFIDQTGPSSVPDKAKSVARAEGVLLLHINGLNTKLRAYGDEIRYCQVTLGDQKKHTQHLNTFGPWEDTLAFLVTDYSHELLSIKAKCKILLATQTLASFEVKISDYLLKERKKIAVPLVKSYQKGQISTSIELETVMEFTPLLRIDDILQANGKPDSLVHKEATASKDQVAGVLYVCVHAAVGLLGLDPNGFSDPYCIVYCNGKKILTTHYIATTKNPTWDSASETTVPDYTKATISFIVYDWDGIATSQDDFLGAAHFTLNKSEPAIIRQRLVLGHNVINQDKPDSSLGSIYVTLIFRPVDVVALAELAELSRDTAELKKQRLQLVKATAEAGATGTFIETQGKPFVDLTIYRGKDLKAADKGGTSDPYCMVYVNGKKTFTSAVIRKNLNPVWEEKIRVELPEKGKTVQVDVYDKDKVTKDTFLGRVIFTKDDLYKFSKQGQSWFQLQETDTGWLQIFISEPQKDNNSGSFASTSQPTTPTENNDFIITKNQGEMSPNSEKRKKKSPLLSRFSFRKRRQSSSSIGITDSDVNSYRMENNSVDGSFTELPASEKYFRVQGRILGVRGFSHQSPSMYCKIRLDNRNSRRRAQKFSHGHVVAKSRSLNPSVTSSFDYAFEIDFGHGIAKEALLILDLKTTSKEHIATKGYVLQDLFQDQLEITQWLVLEKGYELEVFLSHSNQEDLPTTRLQSFVSRLRRGKPKQK